MNKKKYTAAIIGCGRMGGFTSPELAKRIPSCWLPLNYSESIQKIEDVELVACSDLDQNTLKKFADKFDVNKRYDDYKKLIDEIQPDILIISTRTKQRPEIITYASLNNVKAIHAEKPLCTNLREGIKAAKAANTNKVIFSYGTLRHYHEAYCHAKEIIDSGHIGEPIQIIVKHGCTNLLWSHPHSVDLICFFSNCRDVEYVQATMNFKNVCNANSIFIDDDPIIENANIHFSNGVSGVITKAGGLSVTISCSHGEISILADGSLIEISKQPPDNSSNLFLDSERIQFNCLNSPSINAIKDLVAALNKETKPQMDINYALLTQRILLGFVKSSLYGGIRYDISKVEEDFTVSGRIQNLYA